MKFSTRSAAGDSSYDVKLLSFDGRCENLKENPGLEKLFMKISIFHLIE